MQWRLRRLLHLSIARAVLVHWDDQPEPSGRPILGRLSLSMRQEGFVRMGPYSSMRQVRALERYMDNLAATTETFHRLYERVRAERDRVKARLYYSYRDSKGRFVKRSEREATVPVGSVDGLLNDVMPEL